MIKKADINYELLSEERYYVYNLNGEGYAIVGYNRIGDASVVDVKIPSSYKGKPINEIADCTFTGAGYIETVTIPDTVKRIGFEAFSACGNLKSINLPVGLDTIYDESFSGCTSLQHIEIPEGVVEIGEYAFNSCYQLKSVKLPQSLKIIQQRVFSCDYELAEIELPDGLEELGKAVFAESNNVVVKFRSNTYNSENIDELYKIFKK